MQCLTAISALLLLGSIGMAWLLGLPPVAGQQQQHQQQHQQLGWMLSWLGVWRTAQTASSVVMVAAVALQTTLAIAAAATAGAARFVVAAA
jgi:hypothetical protein